MTEIANVDAKSTKATGNSNAKIAKALLDVAENLAKASATCTVIANTISPGPAPPPTPPVPAPTQRRLFGINLGGVDYYRPGLIYNDALWKASVLVGGEGFAWGVDNRGRVITSNGDCSTRFYGSARDKVGGTWSHVHNDVVVGTHAVPGAQQYEIIHLASNAANDRIIPPGNPPLFDPQFTTRLRGVGTLRFMDLRRTNYHYHVGGLNWYGALDRSPSPGFLIYPTVTPEEAVEIAQGVGASGIWWNSQWSEPTERIQYAAQYFKDHWSGELYWEHSNEMWNWGLSDGTALPNVYKKLEAQYGVGNYSAIYGGMRQAANDAFGVVLAIHPTACTVLGVQCVNYGVTNQMLAGDISNIKAVAIAPYWPHVAPASFTGNASDLEAAAVAGLAQAKADSLWQKANAAANGKRLLAYESGHHVWAEDMTQTNIFTDFIRSQFLADQYADFATWWAANINDTLCWFDDCDETAFGLTEHPQESPCPRASFVYNRFAAQL